jgi:hypothetical protein
MDGAFDPGKRRSRRGGRPIVAAAAEPIKRRKRKNGESEIERFGDLEISRFGDFEPETDA